MMRMFRLDQRKQANGNVQRTIRLKPNLVSFLANTKDICDDMSFDWSSVWAGEAFGQRSPITAETMIANRC